MRDKKGHVTVRADSMVGRGETCDVRSKNVGSSIAVESHRENVGQSKVTSREWLYAMKDACAFAPFHPEMASVAVERCPV